jgi:hypothetical protein
MTDDEFADFVVLDLQEDSSNRFTWNDGETAVGTKYKKTAKIKSLSAVEAKDSITFIVRFTEAVTLRDDVHVLCELLDGQPIKVPWTDGSGSNKIKFSYVFQMENANSQAQPAIRSQQIG